MTQEQIKVKKRGRDAELIELRNKRLLERFVYWYEVKKVRLDETLRLLSREEFFISEQRIWCIIKEARGILTKEFVSSVKKPKVTAIRGIPSSVKVVDEHSYTLFPSSEIQ